jgi:hypothetical protein
MEEALADFEALQPPATGPGSAPRLIEIVRERLNNPVYRTQWGPWWAEMTGWKPGSV